jgi:hypothetical protein
MRLPIDWALLSADDNVANLDSHVQDLRVKLAVFNHVAEQAVAGSAYRHSQKARERARDPELEVGSKVLLEDPVVRKSECSKLKMRFAGPFIVTECLPHFNYRLQRLSTGKVLKRPVHASRLRPVKQLLNDYRDSSMFHRLVMRSNQLPTRPTLQVEILLGTVPRLLADALYITEDLSKTGCPGDEENDRFWKEVNRVRQKSVSNDGQCESRPLEGIASSHLILRQTTSSSLDDIGSVITFVDQSQDLYTLVIALPTVDDIWDFSQRVAEQVTRLASNPDGRLRRVTFVTLSLTLADTLSSVFRTVVSSTVNNDTPQVADQTIPNLATGQTSLDDPMPQPVSETQPDTSLDASSQPVLDSQWYAIARILKRKIIKGKPWFLVKWQNCDETSWVPRVDVTDVAIQEFYTRNPARPRRIR